jgi:hypothetical protein
LAIVLAVSIDPSIVGEGQSTAIVAARLVNMGGALFSWTPESGMTPAKALFRFQTRAARDEFLVRMAQIPGVSIATVQ